ncbi:MAG: hypothetical protein U1E56_01545 [Bauldia sp.]
MPRSTSVTASGPRTQRTLVDLALGLVAIGAALGLLALPAATAPALGAPLGIEAALSSGLVGPAGAGTPPC